MVIMSGSFFSTDMDRQVARVRALEEFPVVNVVGAVGADPPGGVSINVENLHIMSFSFAAWLTEGEALQKQTLKVERIVPLEALRRYMSLIRPYTIIKVRARVDTSSPEPRALLETLVGESDHAELKNFLTELQKPVTYQDAVLGTLMLNRRGGNYRATVAWNEASAELSLAADKVDELERLLQTARVLWENQGAWEERMTSYAARELLENANDWSEEDPNITASQFRERMKVETIVIEVDGSFAFFYNDGGLFWGHVIIVNGTLAEGPTDASIAG